jgi:histidinol-phosphate phosphatase family protein
MLDLLGERIARLSDEAYVSRDLATALLLDAAELETALTDLRCAARDEQLAEIDALRALTVACGRLVVARWRGAGAECSSGGATAAAAAGVAAAFGRAAAVWGGETVGVTVRCPVPEGFAYYALYPEMYAQAATRFVAAHRPAQVSVVGVRTIGTALSGVVAAALEARVADVASGTVRPRGHPFDRYVELSDAWRTWIRARADGWFVVVDEGPGISGSSFASVTRALRESGVDPRRIALMPSWDAAAHQLSSEAGRRAWELYPRFVGSFERLWLASGALGRAWGGEIAADWSGGQWRSYADAACRAAAVQPQHERRKYLVRQPDGAEILVKFAGLGRYQRGVVQAAVHASESGAGPRVVGVHGGFVGYERLAGVSLASAGVRRGEISQVARYIAGRPTAEHAHAGASVEDLLEMVRVNVGESLGDHAARRAAAIMSDNGSAMLAAPVVETDNRMQPHEWLRVGDRLVKTDGDGHHDDHFLPGAQNAAWDLAGALEELVRDADARALLMSEYSRFARDALVGERLTAYRVAYLACRVGYCQLASDSLGESPDGHAMGALVRRYRDSLIESLGRDTTAVSLAASPLIDAALVIFDADDTLRRCTVAGQPCPHASDEWELMPGVRDLLSRIGWDEAAGPRFGIASNQDHVGYGLITAVQCERLLRDLAVAATGGRVRDPLIGFCPHTLEVDCACRKPAPGLLHTLLARAGVAAERALFVGNAASDEAAARAAGVEFLWARDLFV